jgi:hypothetical protein
MKQFLILCFLSFFLGVNAQKINEKIDASQMLYIVPMERFAQIELPKYAKIAGKPIPNYFLFVAKEGHCFGILDKDSIVVQTTSSERSFTWLVPTYDKPLNEKDTNTIYTVTEWHLLTEITRNDSVFLAMLNEKMQPVFMKYRDSLDLTYEYKLLVSGCPFIAYLGRKEVANQTGDWTFFLYNLKTNTIIPNVVHNEGWRNPKFHEATQSFTIKQPVSAGSYDYTETEIATNGKPYYFHKNEFSEHPIEILPDVFYTKNGGAVFLFNTKGKQLYHRDGIIELPQNYPTEFKDGKTIFARDYESKLERYEVIFDDHKKAVSIKKIEKEKD